MTEWREVGLAQVCRSIADGDWIETKDQGGSDFRLLQVSNIGLGSFRETGKYRYVTHETFDRLRCHEIKPGMVLVARMPDPVGRAWYVDRLSEPAITSVDVAIIEPDPAEMDGRFCAYLLNTPHNLARVAAAASGTTRLRITRRQLASTTYRVPDLSTQRRIAEILGSFDDLIENNRLRVELLEEMARAIYREWFVHYRYPGHDAVPLVECPLGLIPVGWQVQAVSELASSERWAVTGGPFGSKLGRKDYVPSGVPVLRGGNLSVGGGFDDSDLVYVSPAKAEELQSSTARSGDVVITQRGTLGQVGLIPSSSRYERYVLSQSQMKVTVDPQRITAEFLYAQMRSTSTTARFIAQAMTAGVPHVNLSLLREFEIVVPPVDLQLLFTEAVSTLSAQAQMLEEQRRVVTSMRDFLLPRLVTGRIDVSSLDMDALMVQEVT